jgi:hypothetical protein
MTFGGFHSRKQIDAAFDLGEILVIAECKAKSRSIAFDRGDPTAIDMRRDLVEQALNESGEEAHWLNACRKGTKYDITKYQYLLLVDVTPFKEFIPSLSPRYWITETLPRVLTPDELRDAITEKVRSSKPRRPGSGPRTAWHARPDRSARAQRARGRHVRLPPR